MSYITNAIPLELFLKLKEAFNFSWPKERTMKYSFPKIFQLGTVYVEEIFNDEVEITEKIDGSHFKFWLDDKGEIVTSSKNQQIYLTNSDKLFHPALEWVHSIRERLEPGTIYYGETLCRPKHNTLNYNRVPLNHFTLFGLSDLLNTRFYGHVALRSAAEKLGCDVVPLLFKGHIDKDKPLTDVVDGFLKNESYLGGQPIEGIVIKNYGRYAMVGGVMMPIMMAKYVSEGFKEKHSTNQEWMPQTDKIDGIFRQYATEARWNKAIQHIRERGELEGSPRDIGYLLKEINLDIIEEHKEEIKEALWKELHKKYQGCWTMGFPEYYKRFLLKESNEND